MGDIFDDLQALAGSVARAIEDLPVQVSVPAEERLTVEEVAARAERALGLLAELNEALALLRVILRA